MKKLMLLLVVLFSGIISVNAQKTSDKKEAIKMFESQIEEMPYLSSVKIRRDCIYLIYMVKNSSEVLFYKMSAYDIKSVKDSFDKEGDYVWEIKCQYNDNPFVKTTFVNEENLTLDQLKGSVGMIVESGAEKIKPNTLIVKIDNSKGFDEKTRKTWLEGFLRVIKLCED